MIQKFDAIIIGTGQAGPPLAKSLCQKGYKVAIIEQARFGGSCINTGCTPTKALLPMLKLSIRYEQQRLLEWILIIFK